MDGSLKYRDIVDWTRKQISTGAFLPGDKFLSEAALGQKFGFSRQTVRRALDVLEQEGYVARLQGRGTFVSGGQAAARRAPDGDGAASMTVGLITNQLDDYIFPGIVRGIEGILTAEGYAMQIASTQGQVAGEARALQLMLESRLAGLIVEPTRSGLPCLNTGLYSLIAQRGIPVVFINSYYIELPGIPYAALDDEQAGYAAASHLLDMGHTRIAAVLSHSARQGHLRYMGYARALAQRGLAVQDDLVHWYYKENTDQILHGRPLYESLLTCTAALCFNDRLALSLIHLLRESGRRVPEDLSVIGVDNSEIAKIGNLTSVAHPMERLGEATAKLLLAMIGGAEGKSILFPPKLVMRATVQRWEA